MNKIKILIIILLIGLSGCEDYLDKSPELGLTEDDVFLEYESTRGFLDKCYTELLDIHLWMSQDIRNYSINALSDEMSSMVTEGENFSILTLNAGKWLNQPSLGEVGWSGASEGDRATVLAKSFASLRRVNKVITNLEKNATFPQGQINELLGQAYFLRAWNYFQIIQRWGGMPIFDKVYSPNENLDFERLTYQESNDWLISDLDRAIALLPHVWDESEYGRATKASALALKSMAALYAASPLMQNDLNTIEHKGYGIEVCKKAAQYAHDAIQYIQDGTGGHRYRLMDKDEYANIFYHQTTYASDESLWFKLDGGRRNASRNLRALYVPQRFEDGGTGANAANYGNPTQNIVDMFETLDGYPVFHGLSGYDPQNPFVNRDPRLTNNIILPGEEWGVNRGGKKLYLETYIGGKDYDLARNNPTTANRMISAYACKKFIWPEANGFTRGWTKNSINTIYIRVAQVYLDYAEAMNEAYGPHADPEGYGLTAVEAINIIRNRVGMPEVLSEFTASKETFRPRIRNERAVELMFENHRWHDLRRWMIAEDVLSRPIRGIRATPGPGPKPKTNFTYEVVELTTEERVFQLRQYWYPVAQDHVENLYNFKQNPGW